MASKQHKSKRKHFAAQPVRKVVPDEKPGSIRIFLTKTVTLALLVCGVVLFTDRKGWFNPDDTNNHTQRKWNAFYRFTEKNEVDMVLVGNSHLYAGINPKNLSCALGANCFILAAPGTTLTDAYYCLKEAVAVCKPKIAVVETYAINNYDSHELSDGGLSDQFQSFHARKNLPQKLLSTPALFTSDHYLPAWSNTVRNHSFIFTDWKQIKKNVQVKKAKPDSSLYLGRFVSFTKGLEDSTLLKYDTSGAVVDGDRFSVSGEARKYIRKITDLCRENDIEPVFLTIPMYHRHVKNYDAWKSKLAEVLAPYNPVWLDLQSPYDHEAFLPVCFENSVGSNQHTTYQGSLVATYKLADFIRKKFPDVLPDRSRDAQWNTLFYGEEGYFENYSPKADDTTNIILFQNIIASRLTIREIDMIRRKDDNLVLIKVDKQSLPDPRGKKLRLVVDAKLDETRLTASIDAETIPMFDPPGHYLFLTNIRKNVSVLGIRNAAIIETAEP